MGELKPKKPVVRRRVMKASNSPEPMGPLGNSGDESMGSTCGHSDCGRNCAVRYVGPTSHLRDHHIIHAARGVTHIWSAAIITGFAIVLTGAIALNSAQAASEKRAVQTQMMAKQDSSAEIMRLTKKVESMEALLKRVAAECLVTKNTIDSKAQ